VRARFVVAALALCAGTGWAQVLPTAAPQLGQVSKDSVWVPTPERMIRRLMQLADVTPQDLVIDLGSGDGRMPIHAAKHFGARAIGVELEPNLVELSERSAREQGVADRVRFLKQDLYEADISKATVLALYISPGVMTKLKPRLLGLAPGTRVVSHHFTLGDWEPDETVRVENRTGYLWVVPANLAGTWILSTGADRLEMRISQDHQQLTVQGTRAGKPVHVLGARVRGTEVRFTAFDAEGNTRNYSGRVQGDRMSGDSEGIDLPRLAWSAERR